MLDRAEDNPERDALRRSAIARTIYELIAAGLPGEPLRIGIYGEWGEGKSTVLSFIEFLLPPIRHSGHLVQSVGS